MPTISFDRRIEVTEEEYKKMLEFKMPKHIVDALEEYKKNNPYEEVTDPVRIRETLGEWARED